VVGANLRYVVGRWLAQALGTGFPYGTLVVNLAGCFIVGVVGALVSARLIDRPELVRLVVIVGFLGSLTTFSSFAYETHALAQDGEWLRAGVNLVMSVVGGVAGVTLGIQLAPLLGGGR